MCLKVSPRSRGALYDVLWYTTWPCESSSENGKTSVWLLRKQLGYLRPIADDAPRPALGSRQISEVIEQLRTVPFRSVETSVSFALVYSRLGDDFDRDPTALRMTGTKLDLGFARRLEALSAVWESARYQERAAIAADLSSAGICWPFAKKAHASGSVPPGLRNGLLNETHEWIEAHWVESSMTVVRRISSDNGVPLDSQLDELVIYSCSSSIRLRELAREALRVKFGVSG
jgi:hypothetical protein